jgi:hypothetical protein
LHRDGFRSTFETLAETAADLEALLALGRRWL